MKFSTLKKNKWFVFFSNIYVVILTIFVIWMIFFDTNSLRTQKELQNQITTLKKQREYLQESIAKDKELIKKLKNDEELEKFAREAYHLKKDDEEIYIIEYEDSLKNKNDE